MSGNGVHVCQPVEAIVLEQESKFAQFDQPSQTFLKFAAQFLSNHKSDTNNNPVFKSCLLRIPGSCNSRYVEQNREVKIIQMQKNQTERYHAFRGNTISWIEKLLQTPIDDYRKTTVNLILAPYLINIKKVSYEDALNIIDKWLSKSA